MHSSITILLRKPVFEKRITEQKCKLNFALNRLLDFLHQIDDGGEVVAVTISEDA